jgi:hypothetical protein
MTMFFPQEEKLIGVVKISRWQYSLHVIFQLLGKYVLLIWETGVFCSGLLDLYSASGYLSANLKTKLPSLGL